MMFARGDTISVRLLMAKFESFSKSAGLIANKNKCKVYFGGTKVSIEQEILQITGYSEEELPFKYLEIPRSFNFIIEKIVGRIQHWTGKLLSYIGRLQLQLIKKCYVKYIGVLAPNLPFTQESHEEDRSYMHVISVVL